MIEAKAAGATDPLDGLRRRSERKLQKALYRYWTRQQAALDKAIRRAKPALLAAQAEAQQQQASKAGPQITLDWNAEGRRLDAEIGGLLEDIAALAGTAVKQEVTHLGLSVAWDIWDAAAAERARAYRYTLVKQINESTQQQLGQLVGQWIENGEALPALTERIRKLIPTKPYPGLRDRAELIAQTETTRVYAESRVAGLREAGLTQMVWQTANDELVCPICAPLHDQPGKLDGVLNPDDGQAYTPPAHPGCRCWLTAATDELDALAQAEPVDLEPPAEEAKPAEPPVNEEAVKTRERLAELERKSDIKKADLEAKIRAAQEQATIQFQHYVDNVGTPFETVYREELDAADKERAKLYKQMGALQGKLTQAARKELYVPDPLDVRPDFYGKAGQVDYTGERKAAQRKQIETGFAEFGKLTSKGDVQVLFVNVNWPDPKHYGGDRAYQQWGSIFLPASSAEKTTIHELGHVLEYRNRLVHEQAVAFLERRTAGEEAKKLKDIYQGYDYKDNEIAKSDKLFDAYVGKIYKNDQGDTTATEIVSMGTEKMWSDPVGFAKSDPDYFDFIYGLLRSAHKEPA